ncbi:T9SS type A sorting domain-containing protein [Spirosoma gilvum]
MQFTTTFTSFFVKVSQFGLGLLLILVLSASQTSLAQSGPSCDTYVNKTVADGLGSNSVNSVYAVGNTVYAATGGESDGGLSISTNGGVTFTNRTTTDGLGDDVVFSVYVVGSTVYAGTLRGFSISTDGGATFTNKTTADGLSDDFITSVYAVGSTVYAATQSGLNISTDGGNTFVTKTTADGLGSNFVWGVYAIGTTVYAATGGGVSISTDGGATFANRTDANGLGSNTVYGIYAVGNNVYAATDGGFSMSTDGGATFTNRTDADGLGSNTAISVYAIGSTIYVGTDGGLSISTDGGVTFSTKTDANGLGSNYALSVFALSDRIYVGTDGGLSYCAVNALPVTLLSFSADVQDKRTVKLNWKTTNETNNAYFLLERSKDLKQIETVAKIQAAEGIFQDHSYAYHDEQPIPGTSYYRLRQVDLDGHQTTYRWVSVVVDNQSYGVFPNPVETNQLTLHLDEPETALIGLFTVEGRSISLQRGTHQDGNLTLKTVQKLPAGVYMLRVEERAQVRLHRILVN